MQVCDIIPLPTPEPAVRLDFKIPGGGGGGGGGVRPGLPDNTDIVTQPITFNRYNAFKNTLSNDAIGFLKRNRAIDNGLKQLLESDAGEDLLKVMQVKGLANRILYFAMQNDQNKSVAEQMLAYMKNQEHSDESLEFSGIVLDYLISHTSADSKQISKDMLQLFDEFENIEPEDFPALQMTLVTYKNGYFESEFDSNYNSLIEPFCEIDAVGHEMWAVHFSVQCAILKSQHPDWSKVRLYWEASKEMIHLGLDLVGLVPVVGEVADLTNGIIYTIEGDGVNATLSYASTIPIVGWGSAGIKFAKRTENLISGGTTTLKWIKNTQNLITFGNRSQLRKVLGLAVGDARQAHHIIPWEMRNHSVIQKAAGSANAFHMNEAFNGIPLNNIIHNGSHNIYNSRVLDRLNDIPLNATP